MDAVRYKKPVKDYKATQPLLPCRLEVEWDQKAQTVDRNLAAESWGSERQSYLLSLSGIPSEHASGFWT